MFLLVISGFFTLLFVLHYFIRYGRIGNISSRIVGPKAYPIIGNLYHLQVDNEQLLEKLWKINKEFSPINRLWSLFFSLITIIHPEDVEILLKSKQHLEKTIPYKFLQPWLSTGLITGAGEKWQHRRKIVTPTFHFNILKHFVVTFVEEAQYLVRLLKEEGNGGSIIKDLQEFLPAHTLNAICETAMGISLRGTGEFEAKYRHAVHDFGKIAVYRISRPWYHSDTIFALTQRGRQQKELLKTLHGFSKKIIAERILFHEQTKWKYLQNVEEIDENQIFYEENNKNSVYKGRLALLDLLIAVSLKDNQLDEEGIQEEVDNFMAAGYSTTATALCFALLLIAKHKDVQERIRNEVNTIMQQNDCKLTIQMLQEFSYLERCLKESLRLYPSVHFIARYISHDLQLKKYLIPAGSICNVNIYSLHRNPNIWTNPDIFDADRFLPENTKGRNPYSFIPFSAGPRNCIGQKFAMLELKLMVAYILHNFYLNPVDELDEVKMIGDLVLCSSKPLRLEFIPIK
ncbi:cytochrome P450 4C1-like [Vespa crabro]|uniref:cytochrome P450 4C1-like n=1 Tax=Vespa crabro TaxID=7445 RepID=UPI001F02F892|nr:cytochrome P450 4C1-like [Vespa crabro]